MKERNTMTPRQIDILKEILAGTYETERRDGRSLRALVRRGLIREKLNDAGVMVLPPQYVATARGRTLIDGGPHLSVIDGGKR